MRAPRAVAGPGRTRAVRGAGSPPAPQAAARAASATRFFGERKRVELEDGRELAVGVRLGTPADVGVLVEFNCRLAEESEGIVLDRDVVIQGVANAIARDAGRYFLLDGDGEGGALGSLMITYEWSDWRDGMVWWIQSVYVRREARNRGLFRHLYETVRAQAAAEGARGVRLVSTCGRRAGRSGGGLT